MTEQEVEDQNRAIELVKSLLSRHAKDFLIVVTGRDESYQMIATSPTYALGAIHRAELDIVRGLEDQE